MSEDYANKRDNANLQQKVPNVNLITQLSVLLFVGASENNQTQHVGCFSNALGTLPLPNACHAQCIKWASRVCVALRDSKRCYSSNVNGTTRLPAGYVHSKRVRHLTGTREPITRRFQHLLCGRDGTRMTPCRTGVSTVPRLTTHQPTRVGHVLRGSSIRAQIAIFPSITCACAVLVLLVAAVQRFPRVHGVICRKLHGRGMSSAHAFSPDCGGVARRSFTLFLIATPCIGAFLLRALGRTGWGWIGHLFVLSVALPGVTACRAGVVPAAQEATAGRATRHAGDVAADALQHTAAAPAHLLAQHWARWALLVVTVARVLHL